MVTSRSPRGHHPDDIPEGFRLFAERREGQKRFPAEGLRSRGGRRHPQGGRVREFPPLPILGHRLPHLLEAPRLVHDVVRDLEEESQRPPVSGKALHLLPGPAPPPAPSPPPPPRAEGPSSAHPPSRKRRRRAPKAPKPGPPSTGRSRPRGIPPCPGTPR